MKFNPRESQMFPTTKLIDIWLRHNPSVSKIPNLPTFVQQGSVVFNAGKNSFLGTYLDDQESNAMVEGISTLKNHGAKVLVLYDVPTDGNLDKNLKRAYPKSRKIKLYDCPLANMERGFSGYEKKNISKRKRKQFRRANSALDRIGEVKIEWVSTDNCEFHFERFFELLTESVLLRRENNNNLLRKNYLRDIWCETIGNELRASVIALDDVPISYRTGFVFKDRFLGYMPVFDRAFHQFSLGNLHVYLMLQELSNLGIRVYDFSKGTAENKTSWANQVESLSAIFIRLSDHPRAFWLLEKHWLKECSKVNLRNSGKLKDVRRYLYCIKKIFDAKTRVSAKKSLNEEKAAALCRAEKESNSFNYTEFDYKQIVNLPFATRRNIIEEVFSISQSEDTVLIGNSDGKRCVTSNDSQYMLCWNE